jgi:hypothetical protein
VKVQLKTVHGKYVSAQPDGRFEVRDKAGPWEDFDLEGVDLGPVAPGPGQPPIAPPVEGPTPSESAAYVAAVKAQCLGAGMDLSGPCGAFAIVRRVAWGLRAVGYGLLDKPGGNNCEKFSTDVIVCPNRRDIVDLLQDGGGANTPLWLVRENEVSPDRWRAPVLP